MNEEAERASATRSIGVPLREVYERDPDNPYPARSLFVEALRFAPGDWDWVTPALAERTQETGRRGRKRPVRERVYAANVLFDRALAFDRDNLESSENWQCAQQAMLEFRGSSDEGLTYAATYLSMRFQEERTGVSPPYTWPPERTEHWIVDAATKVLLDDEKEEFGVPHSVRPALRTMVQGALLTIDGTMRRRICEAIQAAGLASDAVESLRSVVDNDQAPPWLVEHAAFIVGYLQAGYEQGAGRAIGVLVSLATNPTRPAAVRHAALWGIGDIAGSIEKIAKLETQWCATTKQDAINPEQCLAELVERCSRDEEDDDVRRAAAYAAAMLARRCTLSEESTAVSTILERLAGNNDLPGDQDPLVKGFAAWGIRIEAARGQNKGYLARSEPMDSSHEFEGVR